MKLVRRSPWSNEVNSELEQEESVVSRVLNLKIAGVECT